MQPLIFSHDGGVDDYVALALLAAELGAGRGTHALLGVVVTGADCFLGPALAATGSMLALFAPDVPLVASTVRGANAFPHEWRATSVVVADLPLLLRARAGAARAPVPAAAAPEAGAGAPNLAAGGGGGGVKVPVHVASWDACRWLADALLSSPVPVDIIETGPLTTIAQALALEPACGAKIGRLYVWWGVCKAW